jgi:hypothetical protein
MGNRKLTVLTVDPIKEVLTVVEEVSGEKEVYRPWDLTESSPELPREKTKKRKNEGSIEEKSSKKTTSENQGIVERLQVYKAPEIDSTKSTCLEYSVFVCESTGVVVRIGCFCFLESLTCPF